GAREGQAAIKLGKPQVVADAKPDRAARGARRNDFAARKLDVGLLNRDAARQIDVEEMDFAIDGQMRAVGAEQHRGGVALGLAGRVLGYRSRYNMQVEFAREPRNRCQRFALQRLRGGGLFRTLAAPVESLGQSDQVGAARRSEPNEALGAFKVGRLV